MGWLVDVLEAFDYHYTPLEILETEHRYPGLIGDMFVERWQRSLISEQVQNDNG